MATTTNYSWSTPDDTALVKDGAAAIRSLGTAIDTTVFTNAGAAINKSIVDAKGDLIAATGADAVTRVAVGTNGQYLKADSTASGGVAWDTLPSSGGMTLIAETVASANTSLSFSGISGSYKQLALYWHGVYLSNASTLFGLRFNADSGSNYHATWSFNGGATGTGVGSDASIAAGGPAPLSYDYTVNPFLSRQAKGKLVIDNYASTTKLKLYTLNFGFFSNGNYDSQNTYDSASAITSIDFERLSGTGNFSNATNTSFRLYGLS
jgi:hypothetical protein